AHRRVLHSFPTRRSSDLWRPGYCRISECFLYISKLPDNSNQTLPFYTYNYKLDRFLLQLFIQRFYEPHFLRHLLRRPSISSPSRSEEHTSELQSRENIVC